MSKAHKQTDLVATYQRLFSTPDGEVVLNDLMRHYFIMSPMVGRKVDTEALLHREGQRSVILFLLKTMEIDIGKMREFIHKANKEQENFYE